MDEVEELKRDLRAMRTAIHGLSLENTLLRVALARVGVECPLPFAHQGVSPDWELSPDIQAFIQGKEPNPEEEEHD